MGTLLGNEVREFVGNTALQLEKHPTSLTEEASKGVSNAVKLATALQEENINIVVQPKKYDTIDYKGFDRRQKRYEALARVGTEPPSDYLKTATREQKTALTKQVLELVAATLQTPQYEHANISVNLGQADFEDEVPDLPENLPKDRVTFELLEDIKWDDSTTLKNIERFVRTNQVAVSLDDVPNLEYLETAFGELQARDITPEEVKICYRDLNPNMLQTCAEHKITFVVIEQLLTKDEEALPFHERQQKITDRKNELQKMKERCQFMGRLSLQTHEN